MSSTYGQYCPLSLAVELLCRRWTMLVVSRLMDGCSHFNEIHRGLPRVSPSLLSRRLTELRRAGLVRTRKSRKHRGKEYVLTEAGWELEPVIMNLAVWGHRWARDMTDEDLDPAFLLWSMHRRMDTDRMPPGRTVVEFNFSAAPPGDEKFWLINRDGEVEMCLKDPGLDVDVLVIARLRTFFEAWRGFRDLRAEIRAGRIKLLGPRDLCAQFPDWLLLSELAPNPRLRPGRERRLARRSGAAAAASPGPAAPRAAAG